MVKIENAADRKMQPGFMAVAGVTEATRSNATYQGAAGGTPDGCIAPRNCCTIGSFRLIL